MKVNVRRQPDCGRYVAEASGITFPGVFNITLRWSGASAEEALGRMVLFFLRPWFRFRSSTDGHVLARYGEFEEGPVVRAESPEIAAGYFARYFPEMIGLRLVIA